MLNQITLKAFLFETILNRPRVLITSPEHINIVVKTEFKHESLYNEIISVQVENYDILKDKPNRAWFTFPTD